MKLQNTPIKISNLEVARAKEVQFRRLAQTANNHQNQLIEFLHDIQLLRIHPTKLFFVSGRSTFEIINHII